MSEKRLIDANALEKHSFLAHLGDNRIYIVPLRAIKSAPAIDAVEVIRCESCAFWMLKTVGYHCDVFDTHTAKTDFCNYGSRRKEATHE